MRALVDLLRHPRSVRVCQVVIGLIFTAAGLSKIGNLAAFAAQIHNFRLVPVPTENLLAMVLPWIEVIAALALILGVRARSAAWIVLALMVVFTVAVAAALGRGLDIECGCFGTGDAARVGARKLVENLGMTALAFVASLRSRQDVRRRPC